VASSAVSAAASVVVPLEAAGVVVIVKMMETVKEMGATINPFRLGNDYLVKTLANNN
jgi:hypothetical protein